MDYKPAINKHNGTRLLNTNQDPFQGHQITQEDNQQRITPGSTIGLSTHDTKTQEEANSRGESQGTKSPDTKPQFTHMASKTTTLPEKMLSTSGAAGCDQDGDVEDDKGEEIKHTNKDPYQGHQADIHLCTPKGENVVLPDVKWERNPYAEACQDSSDLLGIVPGHYLLQANNTAEVLCALVQTDLHSQFYKLAPTSE